MTGWCLQCCTNLHHVLIDLLGVSVNEIDLLGVTVLHNLLFIGVVLVLIRHGGVAGPGLAGDSEGKLSWIKLHTAAF